VRHWVDLAAPDEVDLVAHYPQPPLSSWTLNKR